MSTSAKKGARDFFKKKNENCKFREHDTFIQFNCQCFFGKKKPLKTSGRGYGHYRGDWGKEIMGTFDSRIATVLCWFIHHIPNISFLVSRLYFSNSKCYDFSPQCVSLYTY